ncbi:hypothetical protein JTE90_019430 [Oedothorax gibbosus]|uniref:THAP9-like helix-turn-helix domain-containing protein n=1 Tax=Oedothorax gibbosus TaxID=931172 RepID=A0AAV6TVD3_9ARAC|nr:hypothetical protein JTE90_019430 [Oedothorax gibbosus]
MRLYHPFFWRFFRNKVAGVKFKKYSSNAGRIFSIREISGPKDNHRELTCLIRNFSSHSKSFPMPINSTNATKVQRKAPKKRTLAMEDDLPEALSAIPKKKRLCYLGDFDEADVTSPTKAQKLLQISQAAIMKHKQVVRNLRKSGKRLKKRVESLQGLLEDLKEKSMISDAASSVLKLSSGAAEEFVKRLEMPNSKEKYPADLKAFALTLNFYSAKAYNYVRETFDCHLPHPRTLRKWYNCVNGSPGFTAEAITALKLKLLRLKKRVPD